MAEKTVLVSQQSQKPIKITKWKVSQGNSMSIGRVILLYDFSGAVKPELRKLKSTQAGTVCKLIAQEGAIVKPGEPLFELTACVHPTVMKDMCAECGADLRNDELTSTAASVPMVHSIPDLKVSEELAQKLGKADGDRLLKDRKLVLLVDLDQTLIHTTNDNIPPNIKDVYHFQLYGPNSPWYHTRLRPGTHTFLKNVAPMFELHICTFGARNYAHTITMFLDSDQTFFSNRILSRDECFDPTSKKANLRALFPCGDNMVCIIDDREDVWNHALNLIHVKPYHFFQHTGDINAPPGLDKQDNDDKDGIDLSNIKDNTKLNGNNANLDSIQEENGLNTITNGGYTKPDIIENEQANDINEKEESKLSVEKIELVKITEENNKINEGNSEIPERITENSNAIEDCIKNINEEAIENHQIIINSKESDKIVDKHKAKEETIGKLGNCKINEEIAKPTIEVTKKVKSEELKAIKMDKIIDNKVELIDSKKALNEIIKKDIKESDTTRNENNKTEIKTNEIKEENTTMLEESTKTGTIKNKIAKVEASVIKTKLIDDEKMCIDANINEETLINDVVVHEPKNYKDVYLKETKDETLVDQSKNNEGIGDENEAMIVESTNKEEINLKCQDEAMVVAPKINEDTDEFKTNEDEVMIVDPPIDNEKIVDLKKCETMIIDQSINKETFIEKSEDAAIVDDKIIVDAQISCTDLRKRSEDDLIEIEDPDDYLFHLEDILIRIHRKFYEEYDQLESGAVPDLKAVIPNVRKKILMGKKLVFSGLVPTHIKLEHSKAYQVARSLGATVSQDLEDDSTHLVAVRPGTAKVNAGRRKKNLRIVTPDWLWCCAERWEHVEEAIYPLNSKGSKNRHPPPHCSSPEHLTGYPVHDTPGIRKRTPSGRFMDTINPLMSFSSDDIADMDKEVEDILDSSSDSEDESTKLPSVPEQEPEIEEEPVPPILPPVGHHDDSSSSEDSLTGEYPRGFKRTRDERNKELIEEDLVESSMDEFPSTKFRRGEELDSDLDIGQGSNSEGSVDAPDEVDDGEWNMMGAALEREFLSNN